jgi:MFS family permease
VFDSHRLRRYLLPPVLGFSYIFAFRGFLAYLPPYLRDGGMSEEGIGILVAVFRIAPVLVLVPFGMLGDRFEPRRLVTVGLVLFGLGLFASAEAESFVLLLLLFLLVGVGGSLFMVNNRATYYKTLGDSTRATKLGWYQGVVALGFGVGPLAAAWIIQAGWLRSPMLVGVVLILPFVFLSLLGERVPGTRISLPEYAGDLSQPGVWVLAAVVFLFSVHFGVEASCFTLFLQDVLAQDTGQIGLTYLYISLVLAPVMLVTGVLSDRVHRPFLFGFVALLCSGIGNTAMPWIASLGWLLAARFVHVAGDGAFMVFQSVTIANLFHHRRLGGNVGLFATIGNVGSFVGAFVSGFITGNAYPFFVAGVLAFIGVAVFALFGGPLWRAPSESAPEE